MRSLTLINLLATASAVLAAGIPDIASGEQSIPIMVHTPLQKSYFDLSDTSGGNIMLDILKTIGDNVKHAIPVNTIPEQLKKGDVVHTALPRSLFDIVGDTVEDTVDVVGNVMSAASELAQRSPGHRSEQENSSQKSRHGWDAHDKRARKFAGKLATCSSFPRRQAKLSNGHTYDYVDARPSGAVDNSVPTVLLLHGFPDSWFGYRYTIVALVKAGFRCIVPSQLGYYPSSQPDDIAAYGFRALSRDTDELLTKADAPQQILLVGHDWGGHHAWRFAAYCPQRVKAIAVISTPYTQPASQPTSKFMSNEDLVNGSVPNFGYQMWFETPEASELLHKNLELFFVPSFSQTGKRLPLSSQKRAKGQKSDNKPWSYLGVLQGKFREAEQARQKGIKTIETPSKADDPELHFYLDTFRKGGMHHPLNYYRNRRICFDEEQDTKLDMKFPASVPALFITGTADAALPLSMSDRSPKYFAKGGYRRTVVDGAGHWMLQDAKHRDEVANHLVAWAKENSNRAKL